VRLDSFAKFLAPGLRLGWVTAAAPLVQKLSFCIHGTTLGACATTQVSLRFKTQFTSGQINGADTVCRRCVATGVHCNVRHQPGFRMNGIISVHQLACIHNAELAVVLVWLRVLMGTSSPAQVLVKEMIDAWGPSGLEQHAKTMQQSYAHRAKVVLAAAGARRTQYGPDWSSPEHSARKLLPTACHGAWCKHASASDARVCHTQTARARLPASNRIHAESTSSSLLQLPVSCGET